LCFKIRPDDCYLESMRDELYLRSYFCNRACETEATYLDFSVIEVRKLQGSHLIVIARLGAGDKSVRLSRDRLAVVEEYILRRGSDLKYVLADGSRVKGLVRVELYVGGRLYRSMPLEKNAPTYCIPGREGS